MNKWLLLVIVLLGINLIGCSNGKPPKVSLEVGNETYETILGTYCWGTTCVDTVGPVEIMADKEPIHVAPGEIVSLEMNYDSKPNEVHLAQLKGSKEVNIVLTDNYFSAPVEKGVYYYAYSVWWVDEKDENLSRGDAFYAFALEVE